MNRITSGQLCAMGLIGEAAALFCMAGDIGWKTAAGFAAAAVILFAAVLPFALSYDRGGRLSRGAELVLLVWTVYWGGRLFSMQWRASEVIYIPCENSGGIAGKLLVSGLIGAVCLYISSTGAKALGRASVIAAGPGAKLVVRKTAKDGITVAVAKRAK